MIREALTTIYWRIGVFLMIYAPVLNIGLGAFGDMLALICVILILRYLYASLSKPVLLLPEIRNLSLLVITTIAYGLLGAMLFSSEPGSLQVALRPLRALIMLGGLYLFVLAYAERFRDRFADALLYDVFIAIGIHALIMIAQFVFPDFRNALYPYTYADQVIEYNQRFRMAGLTNGGGAQLSLFQSAGLLLFPLVMLRHKNIREKISSSALAVCIVISILLSGRSGIMLILVMLPAIIILSRRNGVFALLTWGTKTALGVGVLIGILYAASFIEIEGLENWAYAEQAVNRSTDFLYRDEPLMEHGVVLDLKGMVLLPEDAKTLLFGDPYIFETSYMGEDRVLRSDIGYVVFMFGYGLLGSLIQYAFYVLIFWYGIRYWRYNRSLALMSSVWAVSILVFHAKEVLVFSRMGFSFTVMFIAALAIERAKARMEERRR